MENGKKQNYKRTQLPIYKGGCLGYGVDEDGNALHVEGCPRYFLTYEFEKKRKIRSDQCQMVFNRSGKNGSGTRSKSLKRIEKQEQNIAEAKQRLAEWTDLLPADKTKLETQITDMEQDMLQSKRQLGLIPDDALVAEPQAE